MTEKNKKIFVSLLECDKPTKSGRIYSNKMMKVAIEKAGQIFVYWGNTSMKPCLRKVAGKADVYMDGDRVVADVELLDTSEGGIVKDLIETVKSPYSVSFFPGGYGKTDEDGNVSEYKFKQVGVEVVRDDSDDGEVE
jgi:hypothetical protein